MAERITGALHIIIKNAGHAVTIDQPGLFNSCVLGFLENRAIPRKFFLNGDELEQISPLFVFNWFTKIIQQINRPVFLVNFARDPIANSIAVVVLVFMIASVIAVVISFLKEPSKNQHLWPKWSIPVLAVLGME